jgi:hypothetical protein
MPLHEHAEGILISIANEQIQELTVGMIGPRDFGNAAVPQ